MALASIYPRYFPSTNYYPLFVAMTSNYNYAYFTQDANRWDSMTEAFRKLHNICPSLMRFHISGITRADLSTISQASGWGNPKKAITRYGLSSAGAITGGGGREKVWPSRGMGPPQPIPSFLPRGGSKETYFTYQHKRGLVLHPCASH